jgi:SAM-dependent methyltransferase
VEPLGATSFRTATGDAYDRYMGRYSAPLAARFADAVGVAAGQRALDVGCGPGALTAELARRLGAASVAAVDPAPPFVASTAERNPGVEVRAGRAEALPFEDHRFDVALAQLVLHFVADPPAAASEMRRVVRPGGAVAACVWEFAAGMEMLRLFWDAALELDPAAPDEARALRFGRQGEIAALFTAAGLRDVVEGAIDVRSTYASFDELWSGYLAGIGPAGEYCVALPEDRRDALRAELYRRLGSPSGSFALAARAWYAVGRAP